MEKEKNSLAVPVSIVIAGAFIAIAVYFSGSGKTLQTNIQGNPGGNNAALASVGTAEINIRPISEKDHIVGNPNAQTIIVEYSDTECPFCKQFHNDMHKLMESYGKDGSVAWVYRYFPLDSLHKKARNEAKATVCAANLGGNDKFWSFLDRLFEVTPSNDNLDPNELPKIAEYVGLDKVAFDACLSKNNPLISKIIEDDYQEAIKAGGNGTPFSIIISQKKFDGAKMKDSINAIMKKYGLPPDFFFVSNDNMKVSVSGAMTYEIMEQFIKVFKAL